MLSASRPFGGGAGGGGGGGGGGGREVVAGKKLGYDKMRYK
jgi:hypothetical protein